MLDNEKPELTLQDCDKFIAYLEVMKKEFEPIKPFKDCVTTILIDLKVIRKRIKLYGKDKI